MARVATGDELDLLRSNGQGSKLYAAFFVPHVVYTAVLSSVPSSTDQIAEISFGSGSGTLANVKVDMLLKVGSTAGSDDLGIARIRKTPIAGTFYIGEQSVIRWAAAATVYLTVVDDFDLWSKHVRIDGTTVYMDYDIAYSNQHTVFSPVPVLGPIVSVAKIEDGETDVTIQVGPETGYQSWVIGSTISTYLWSCATAASISSTSAVRPTMTFEDPGWHLIYCTVTAANGKTRQGVRYVYIWDKDNPPSIVAQLGDNVEDNKIGGSNFELSFSGGASIEDIPDRALCVLFAEDYYGIDDDQQKISLGAVTGRENILYTGRVSSESLSYDDETSTASISVQGYQELFKKVHGFPAGLRFKITPVVWTDMPSLTVDRALFHLLEYHSTALTVMDFNRTSDTKFTAQAFSPFSSIWEQMKEFAEKQILANTRVDHLGRLFFEVDPQLLPVASRTYPVVMTLTDGDLTGRVEIPRETLAEVGQVNLSGVAVDNGGNPIAFFSLFPGHVHERTGSIKVVDRLLLSDQTHANELSGLIYAKDNNPYKPMRVKFSGNNRLVTCFPNQAVAYTIEADKNPRGFEISKNWIPRQRKFTYDPEAGFLSVEFVLEAETVPGVGVNGDIPGSDSDFSFPPLPSLPSLPSIPIILPGGPISGSDGGPSRMFVHSPTAGCLLCDNFDAGENDQEWYAWNTGLTSIQAGLANQFMKTPSGAIYATRRGGGFTPFTNDDVFLYRAPYAGGEFVLVENLTTMRTKMGLSGSTPAWVGGIACNPLAYESVLYTLWDGSQLWIFTGDGATFTHTSLKISAGSMDSSISYGMGKWRIGGNGISSKLWILNSAGSALLDTKVVPTHLKSGQMKHVPISTSDKFYLVANLADDTISLVEDNGNTITHNIGSSYANSIFIDPNEESEFCVDPTGQTIMTTRASTNCGRSSDFGATLTSIPNLPAVFFRFAWAGGVGSTSKWIAVSSYVYYTDNFWNSAPIDKRGNILSLVPVLDLDMVLVLEI